MIGVKAFALCPDDKKICKPPVLIVKIVAAWT